MKRSRLFLAFVVAISLIAAPSFAAVKAGAKCTKAGATSTTGGKKYTCVKSGSKLVWNKGVAVKAAAKPNLNPVFKPTTPTQPATVNPVENAVCTKVDEEIRTTSGLFKCQLRSDGQLFWSKSNPPPVINEKCPKLDQEILTSEGMLKCEQRSDGQLVWGMKKQTPIAPAPTPTPTPTPTVTLPLQDSQCTKIGEKVFGNNGYMKCIWSGGPTNDFLKNVVWRFYPVIKVSSSKSNNYTTTPVEKAPCAISGDTYDVAGGILECRWINGGKLQWIKINTVKSTFTNAKSPVSIDMCKLQNSASVADRTGRNASGLVGFPLVNTDRHRMNLKGSNEVLIVPIDFPDFPGGNEVLAQLEYDKKWMTDWYQYFSNGQSKFNVTTVDKWLRMPKERAAYPSDAKTKDAFAADHGRRMADQAQPFIDEITKVVDLRKFSTVYFFYPNGEITFVDFIIRNQMFKTKEGEVQLNLFSWGKNLEGMETLKWSYYIHETMHDFGISMHAPGNGWPLSIGTNQSGISLALNPWEQFLFDWLPADQIYCDDFATLKNATISLSPVEREDRQTKMAVIRLTPTKAIVVESHGIDKWSDFKFGDREFPPGFYSVMAYIVDLDKNAAPPINSDGTSLGNDEWAWAVWQKPAGTRSNQFNINVGDRKNLADYVAVLGDSFVIEGVRIKFVGTGDYETIEISKA
jgi:hypothetical protein